LILGEAPGKAEVVAGIPFVGKSGQLLRKALKELKITDYCIDNACPCGVTKDFDYELMKRCLWERYARRDYDLIIVLGQVAKKLLENFNPFNGRIIYMHHPAYVLRGGTSYTLWLWLLKEELYGPDSRINTM